jgi:hypothetical protein
MPFAGQCDSRGQPQYFDKSSDYDDVFPLSPHESTLLNNKIDCANSTGKSLQSWNICHN